MPSKIEQLYQTISAEYEVGSLQDFEAYLADPQKRQLFFEQIIAPNYDVASLSDFEDVYELKKKDGAFPLQLEEKPSSLDSNGVETPTSLGYSIDTINAPRIDERGYTAAGETYATPTIPPQQIREQVREESGAALGVGIVGAVLKDYLPENFTELDPIKKQIALEDAAAEYQADIDAKPSVASNIKDVVVGASKELTGNFLNAGVTSLQYFLDDKYKDKLLEIEDPEARWVYAKSALLASESLPTPLRSIARSLVPQSSFAEDLSRSGAEQQAKVLDEYDKGVTQYLIDGDYGNAGALAFYQAMASAPTLLAAMAGPAGIASLGLSSFSGFTKEDVERGDNIDLSDFFNNVTKAGAEAFFEQYTGKLGRRAFSSIVGNKAASEQAASSIVKEVLKGFGLGVAEEGGSEAATAATQLLSDAIFAGRDVPMVEAMKQISDAFIVGGLMGGPLSGTGAGFEAARKKAAIEIAPKSDKDQLQKNISDKIELEDAKAKTSNPEVVSTIDGLISEIDKKTVEIEERLKQTVDFMTDEELAEVTQLKKDIDALAIKATQVNEDPNISESQRTTTLALLKQQAESAIQKRQTIIDNAVQKQATSKVPVQPKARVGEEMAEGAPETKPEVVTEEGKEEVKGKRQDNGIPFERKTITLKDEEGNTVTFQYDIMLDGSISRYGADVLLDDGTKQKAFLPKEVIKEGPDSLNEYIQKLYEEMGYKVESEYAEPYKSKISDKNWNTLTPEQQRRLDPERAASQGATIAEEGKEEVKRKLPDNKIPFETRTFTLTDDEGNSTTYEYKVMLDGRSNRVYRLREDGGKESDDILTEWVRQGVDQLNENIQEVFVDKYGFKIEGVDTRFFKSEISDKNWNRLTSDQQRRLDPERAASQKPIESRTKDEYYEKLSQPVEGVPPVPPSIITASDTKALEDKYQTEQDPVKKQAYKDILRSFKVLRTIMPGLEIHVYEKNADYVGAKNPEGSAGNFLENVMSLNLEAMAIAESQADVTKHEAVHPIMEAMFRKNPDLANRLYDELQGFQNDKTFGRAATHALEFSQQYADKGEGVVKMEAIVEFMAMVATKYDVQTKKDPTLFERLKNFVNGVAELVGIKMRVSTEKDLVTIARTISYAFLKEADVTNVFDIAETPIQMTGEVEARAKKESALTPTQSKNIDQVILKSIKDRKKSSDEAIEDAQKYLENSPTFLEADDITRENMIREFKDRFYQKIKKAPGVKTVLDDKFLSKKLNVFVPKGEGAVQPKKKVLVDEAAALKDQIRMEAKAAKDAVSFVNSVRKSISAAVKSMEMSNKISSIKARAIINKLSNVNLLNPKAVDGVIDYIAKVFSDAKYMEKVSDAKRLSKAIKKLAKNKALPNETAKTASKFAEVDYRLVEDIDEYLRQAESVYNAIKPSKIKVVEGVAQADLKQAMVYDEVLEYANEEIKKQEQIKVDNLMAENEYLVEAGVITGDMSLEEVKFIIDSIKESSDAEIAAERATIVRDYIRQVFGHYSTIMRAAARENIDPITGEELDLDEKSRLLAIRFAAINPDFLQLRDAIAALDAMNNFLTNGNTDGMAAVVAGYEKTLQAERDSKTFKAKTIRYLGNNKLGQFFFRNFGQIQLAFEAAFKSPLAWNQIALNSGFSEFTKGKTRAQIYTRAVIDRYNDFASKIKDYHTSENTYERGMYAFMYRTITDTEVGKKKEFDRQKGLIEQSINGRLKYGTPEQQKAAEIEMEVYNRILRDSNNIDELSSKVKDFNKQGVQFWVDEYAKVFDKFQDASRSVHNLILSEDMNYTPQRWSKIGSEDMQAKDIEDITFVANNKFFYDKKSGSFIERNQNLKNLQEKPTRGVNLEFDTMVFNAFLESMVDAETAESVKGMNGYFNSPGFIKMVPNNDDRAMLKRIMMEFISESKKGNYIPATELKAITRWLDTISAFGTARALGSMSQAVLQTVPVMMNTLINSGRLDLKDWKNAQEWLANSGFEISVRGLTSRADVQEIKSLIKIQEEGKPEKFVRELRKFNEKVLEKGLGNFDKWIAEVSWISYYKQNLEQRGIDTSNIDWTTHEVDQIAGQYAQSMVNRNQNVSDIDQIGKVFKDQRDVAVLVRKMAFAFASFSMNQKARMAVDAKILRDRDGNYTQEQKGLAIKSLAATGVEMAVYRGLQFGLSYTLFAAAKALVGAFGDDDEIDRIEEMYPNTGYAELMEKKEFRKWAIGKLKYSGATAMYDIMSPIPLTDPAIGEFWNLIMQDPEWKLPPDESGTLRQLGTYGIAGEKFKQSYEMLNLAFTGEYEYEGRFGKKKMYISQKDMDAEMIAGIFYSMYAMGLLPETMIAKTAYEMHKLVKKNAVSKPEEYMTEEELQDLQDQLEETIEDIEMRELSKEQRAVRQQQVFEGL